MSGLFREQNKEMPLLLYHLSCDLIYLLFPISIETYSNNYILSNVFDKKYIYDRNI